MIGKKQNKYELIWYIIVFAFVFIWFTQIHPLVIFDADDWTYISNVRKATPIWGAWNPSKVFPEVIMPLCSRIAVYGLEPLIGDFLTALTVMNAIVTGIFITVYVWSFGNLLKRVFALSSGNTIFASALFLIFHFLVFRSEASNNSYLFYCHNVNCYYNYLFPSLLNASLVMYMMHNERFEEFLVSGSTEKRGFFILIVYFAIFSHLPASGILAVYAGCRILIAFVKQLKGKFQFLTFAKSELLDIAILVGWLCAAIFELSGGNAKWKEDDSVLLQNLKETLSGLAYMTNEFNTAFVTISAIILLLAVSVLVGSRLKNKVDTQFFSLVLTCLFCTGVMLVYILALYTKAGSWYIYRNDCRFGIVFYGFLVLLLSFGYVIAKCPKVVLAIPVVLCVLASEIDTTGKTFLESTRTNTDAAICVEISNDFINQIVNAEQAGQTEMDLYVPIAYREDNWPFANWFADRIQPTLYEYGIITRQMNITVVPSEVFNAKYQLPVPLEAIKYPIE